MMELATWESLVGFSKGGTSVAEGNGFTTDGLVLTARPARDPALQPIHREEAEPSCHDITGIAALPAVPPSP